MELRRKKERGGERKACVRAGRRWERRRRRSARPRSGRRRREGRKRAMAQRQGALSVSVSVSVSVSAMGKQYLCHWAFGSESNNKNGPGTIRFTSSPLYRTLILESRLIETSYVCSMPDAPYISIINFLLGCVLPNLREQVVNVSCRVLGRSFLVTVRMLARSICVSVSSSL
jgi:hypothetical protein